MAVLEGDAATDLRAAHAGRDRVRADVVGRELRGQVPRERDDAAFGDVVGDPRGVGLQRRSGREVHDGATVALGDHLLGYVLAAEVRPAERHVQDALPLLVGQIDHRLAVRDGGAVGQDVYLAEAADDRLDHGFDGRGAFDWPDDVRCPATGGLDLLRHGGRAVLVGVVNGDLRALGGEQERDGAADVASAARHHRDLAFELHGWPHRTVLRQELRPATRCRCPTALATIPPSPFLPGRGW